MKRGGPGDPPRCLRPIDPQPSAIPTLVLHTPARLVRWVDQAGGQADRLLRAEDEEAAEQLELLVGAQAGRLARRQLLEQLPRLRATRRKGSISMSASSTSTEQGPVGVSWATTAPRLLGGGPASAAAWSAIWTAGPVVGRYAATRRRVPPSPPPAARGCAGREVRPPSLPAGEDRASSRPSACASAAEDRRARSSGWTSRLHSPRAGQERR